jgi:NTE family protein
MLTFTLVLAGGGARGFAHAGVLRVLDRKGMSPSALVGVSMGAVVAATYASRTDWYDALLDIDAIGFPHPVHGDAANPERPGLLRAFEYVHTAWNMVTGWGAPGAALDAGRHVLSQLLGRSCLENGRVPVAVCATDLRTGHRTTLRSGLATEAVYASAALAGLLPPLWRNDQILADGAYADIAPIDVARGFGHPIVIVVDPGQSSGAPHIDNGLQAVMRAMEICHRRHAELRMREADLVIRPHFGRIINVLEFDALRECVAAGARAVRRNLGDISALLHGRTCDRPRGSDSLWSELRLTCAG